MRTRHQPLLLPADPRSLDEVTAYVLKVVGEYLRAPTAYRMRLAADEVATNIVTHGRVRGGQDLSVSGGVDDDMVWIRFRDTGPAFDPHSAAAPDLTLPPALRPVGGLGLHLAFNVLDRFDYERVDGANINTLGMRRDGR